ncbi:MAG: hypothetical protein JJ878_01970 [Alphaproteobacteria bacterium]|nr:hypothetical protein [Alphaproteobacteria bacterium]MBO6861376.1 hypothetical protein [Alphaproteobacteria bacterium]
MTDTAQARPLAARRRGKALLSRGMARVLHHGAWKFRHYECVWSMAQKELASTVRVPVLKRPGLLRRGYLSESWVLYDLARNDRRDYLPDYARFTKTRLINGRYSAILDNKLLFDRIVGSRTGVVPHFYGILENGQLIDVMTDRPSQPAAPPLIAALRKAGALVLKPLTGGGGRGIEILRHEDGRFLRNGDPIEESALAAFMEGCSNYLACEYLEQHPDLRALNPDTVNTVRILTMQDDRADAFIARAILRIGTRRSAPTDNWTRGGLSAMIDIETGALGPAVSYPDGTDRLIWHAVHPETQQPIEGTVLPNWDKVRDGVLDVFRHLPVLKYVGWDAVVTEDGYRLLEGNNYSDVNLLQVHGPLLRDRRVRSFYARHGILA